MKAVDIGQYLCVAVFLNEPGFALIKHGKICRHGNEGHKGRQFYSHRSLEAGGTAYRAHQDVPDLVSRQREQRENVGKRLYCGFCKKELARQGK